MSQKATHRFCKEKYNWGDKDLLGVWSEIVSCDAAHQKFAQDNVASLRLVVRYQVVSLFQGCPSNNMTCFEQKTRLGKENS